MNVITKLFKRKQGQAALEEAVIVYLDAQGLPNEVYETHDLDTLEHQLVEAIESAQAGEFDGSESGSDTVTLFMYGPNAERLFETVEAPLRAYPLCSGAKVIIRQGSPGSPERTVVLNA